MNSSDLPADDQAPIASAFDQRLQLELQEGVSKLFYQSCDPLTQNLLTKCEWRFQPAATGLTLEISCFEAETYQAIGQVQARMNHLLQKLCPEQPQIHIHPPAQPAAAPEAARPSALNPETIAPPLQEQIVYGHDDIHQVVLAKDQRGQFSLLCISAGDGIPTHAALQGTAIYVLEGQGQLDRAGSRISLQPGSFVYIPPKTSQTLKAIENLALLCAWV